MLKRYLAIGVFLCVAFSAHSSFIKKEKFKLTIRYQIECEANCRRVCLTALLPTDIEGKQEIMECRSSRMPDSVYVVGSNQYVFFDFKHPNTSEDVFVSVIGELSKADYATLKKEKKDKTEKKIGNKEEKIDNAEDVSKFLLPEKWIQSDSLDIRERAALLLGGAQEQTLKNIFNFVSKQCTYVSTDVNKGALEMLRTKKGDCTEFTDLFVALCRAAGLPARHVSGVNTVGLASTSHSWAECYIDSCGWVVFDPTPGNDATFQRLDRPYVLFSLVRNDDELNGYSMYKYNYWGTPANVRVNYLLEMM